MHIYVYIYTYICVCIFMYMCVYGYAHTQREGGADTSPCKVVKDAGTLLLFDTAAT